MNNSRSDRFDVGAAEARGTGLMSIADLKQLPSGDAPGKTVGDILGAKRTARNHRIQVASMKAIRLQGLPVHGNVDPVTIKDGVLIDGHHRVAAGEDAGLSHLPFRRTP